jgi:hypothetical protein
VDKVEGIPAGTKRALLNCFQWIPELDLVGIDRVEFLGTLSDLSFEPVWWAKRCKEKEEIWVNGVYCRKHEGKPAFICFFLKALYSPLWEVIRFRPMTTLYFSRFVGHEVGHHLIATRGFVFAPDEKYESDVYEEEMANRYAFQVVQRMKSKWYYRLADRVLKFFSKVHFEDGRQNWKKEKYAAAASSWYKAWLLDHDNEKASELYWQAKLKSSQS